jgi:hypothetical protein
LALLSEYEIKEKLDVDKAIVFMEIANGLVRGVLKSEDPHGKQLKTILEEALNDMKPTLSEESYTKLKNEIYKISTGSGGELDKLLQGYNSKVKKTQLY